MSSYSLLTVASLFGKTLLLRPRTGSGHGMPTASQAVRIARYQPHTRPMNPNPPAMCSNLLICSTSASVVACPMRKSAAAMKENSIMRPKNVRVKKILTRKVPIKNTKLAIALIRSQTSIPLNEGSGCYPHCDVVESLG